MVDLVRENCKNDEFSRKGMVCIGMSFNVPDTMNSLTCYLISYF